MSDVKKSNNKGAFKFIKESFRNLKTVGTITRSSKFLCEGMIKPIEFDKARVIVELGAGDGVVTKHILRNMRPDAILLAFEVNEQFCNSLREINDHRLVVVEDSAEKLKHYLVKNDLEEIDYVVSALPFTIMPDDVAYSIIHLCKKLLKNNGLYIQIHYSLLPIKRYKKIFGNIDLNFVPLNVPPAWVLVSRNVA